MTSVKNHILVPKHSKLPEKEKKELLERYGITTKELPIIFVSDPSISHLTLTEGDVVKITRESPTAKTSLFYRRVAHD